MRLSKISLTLLFTLGVGGGVVRAEQTGSNPEFGLFGGAQFGDKEIKSGPAVLGLVGERFTPYFAVDIQGGWIPTRSKVRTLSAADLSIASVEFIPRIYAPLGKVQPYIAAGAGRFFISERLDAGTNVALSQTTEDVDNKWAGIFGGGVEVAINENFSFGVDVAYIYLRTTARFLNHTSIAAPGLIFSGSRNVNLDMLRAVAGFRVKFNSPGWTNVY
jgi:hypothetical protein